MDDALVQELRAAKDSAEKAAIIAEAVLSTLPEDLALLARRCVILHWFDHAVLAALLQEQASAPGGKEVLYQQLAALPFLETVPWGLTFQDLTREGLLRRYATNHSSLLKASARRAASAYAAQSDVNIVAEAFYCCVVAGDQQACADVLAPLLARVSTHQDWHLMRSLLSLKEEAERLPGVSPLPLTEQFWVLAGLAHWEQGEYTGSLRDYDRAIALNPKSALAYASRGNAYAEQQHNQQALSDYTRAIELDPTFVQVYINRGVLASKQERYQVALKDFDQALLLDTYNGFALYQKGKVLNELGRYEDASACFERALLESPKHAALYIAQGDAFYGLERYIEALSAYNTALSLDDRQTTGYRGKGNTLQALKRYVEATAAYERARSLDASNTDAEYEESNGHNEHDKSNASSEKRREKSDRTGNASRTYVSLDDHFHTDRLRRSPVSFRSAKRSGLFEHRLGRSLALVAAIFIVLAAVILFHHTLIGTNPGGKLDPGPGRVTVIVLDMSGSMATNDPNSVRCSAADAYIDLGGQNDLIGVIGLDGNQATTWSLPTPVATLQQRSALKDLIAIKSNNCAPDANTPTADALDKALQLLSQATQDGKPGSVILLTDGVPDPDPQVQEQRIEGQLVPVFQDHKWPVDSIALGTDTNFDFLHRGISDATGGLFYQDTNGPVVGDSPLNIASFFVDLFRIRSSLTAGPTSATPLRSGVRFLRYFQVGDYIDNLTITALKDDPNAVITLVDPKQNTITLNTVGALVTTDPHYAIYSIDRPEQGSWTLNVTGSNGYFLMDSLIKSSLQVNMLFPISQQVLPLGQAFTIQAQVTKAGNPIRKNAFSLNATITIQDIIISQGPMVWNDADAAYTFATSIADSRDPGSYTITVSASSGSGIPISQANIVVQLDHFSVP